MKNLKTYKCMKKIRHIIVLLLSMGITCAYANNESFI